jgi:hypothetical protein
MTIYKCNICDREFRQKCHLNDHLNKKKPCIQSNNNILNPANNILNPANIQLNPANIQLNLADIMANKDKFIELLFKEPFHNDNDNDNKNDIICIYCEKVFTRVDSLKKHQLSRCKSKTNHDDLEKLKEDMKIIITNLKNVENENANLKNNYQELENNYQKILNDDKHNKIINKKTIKKIDNTSNSNNNSNNTNTNTNNINNGVVNNINIVQFGNEDIDKLNLPEAVKQYLISTGGNIASNMLKYINLNEKYPENHNICITDISRELVKIHNGKKFITKKFKNVKNDIMKNVVKNTRKIMTNYENDDRFKKSVDIKTKLKINDVSLRLIDGESAEDIVREEVKDMTIKNGNPAPDRCLEKESLLNYNKNDSKKDIYNSEDDDSESEEERDFTLDERLRVEHLDKKREGLQIKTFENLKDELYNGRELLITNI